MNIELAERVLDHVRMYPEQHNQEHFSMRTECGTQHCIAGRVMVLSGEYTYSDLAFLDSRGRIVMSEWDVKAAKLLGLPGSRDEHSLENGHPLNEVFFIFDNNLAIKNFEALIDTAKLEQAEKDAAA